jgi:hypothetical protein
VQLTGAFDLVSRSVKLLLALASTMNLGSGPVWTHDHIFVLFKTFTCFEMGPPLRREEGSDYYWSLPFTVGPSAYLLTTKFPLALASTAILGSESHATHNRILLSGGFGRLQTSCLGPYIASILWASLNSQLEEMLNCWAGWRSVNSLNWYLWKWKIFVTVVIEKN